MVSTKNTKTSGNEERVPVKSSLHPDPGRSYPFREKTKTSGFLLFLEAAKPAVEMRFLSDSFGADEDFVQPIMETSTLLTAGCSLSAPQTSSMDKAADKPSLQ